MSLYYHKRSPVQRFSHMLFTLSEDMRIMTPSMTLTILIFLARVFVECIWFLSFNASHKLGTVNFPRSEIFASQIQIQISNLVATRLVSKPRDEFCHSNYTSLSGFMVDTLLIFTALTFLSPFLTNLLASRLQHLTLICEETFLSLILSIDLASRLAVCYLYLRIETMVCMCELYVLLILRSFKMRSMFYVYYHFY